jgi:hypothetical protein
MANFANFGSVKLLRFALLLSALTALVLLSSVSAEDKPQDTQMVTMDDLFAKVGEKVSGFGGFFYDQDDVPTIYMQESQDASSATQAKGCDVACDATSIGSGLRNHARQLRRIRGKC